MKASPATIEVDVRPRFTWSSTGGTVTIDIQSTNPLDEDSIEAMSEVVRAAGRLVRLLTGDAES